MTPAPGNPTPAPGSNPHDLIDAYLEGTLTEAQRTEFESALRTSPELRAELIRRLDLHAALTWRTRGKDTAARAASAARTHDTPPSPPLPIYRKGHAPSPKSESRIPKFTIGFSIAAALLAACGVAIFLFLLNPEPSPPEPPTKPLATLIQNTTEGTLTTPGGFISEGRDYPRGEYALDRGAAEFMLTNAVNVKLRGNTRMSMRSDMNVSLALGSAEFIVPQDAKGFTVHLPGGARVVDLGTAFRVTIDDDGRSRVRVTEGAIELHTPDGDAAPRVERMEAGSLARLQPDGGIAELHRRGTLVWTGADDDFFNEANWELFGEVPPAGTVDELNVLAHDVVIGPGAGVDLGHTGEIWLGDGGKLTATDAEVTGGINATILPFDRERDDEGAATVVLNGSTRFSYGWAWHIQWELNDRAALTANNRNRSAVTGPLGKNSTVNLNGPDTSLTLTLIPLEEAIAPEWIAKLRVAGEPAVLGVNLSATAVSSDDGEGTVFRPIHHESSSKRSIESIDRDKEPSHPESKGNDP